MKRLTDEELAELQRLATASGVTRYYTEEACEDMQFIPRMLTAAPSLLAEVRELRSLKARTKAAGKVLSNNGCDCDCGHDPAHDDHDEDCEPCLACRVADALEGYKP